MATVDRKTNDGKEHSLSSFDKRKVQSVTFGARHFDRKKYKVVNHGTVSPRNIPNQNVRCQVDNEHSDWEYFSEKYSQSECSLSGG